MSSKYFFGSWYPDEDPSHMFAMKFLIDCKVNYCAIDHDKDLDEDGNIKKKHTHVLIKFPNERYLDNVCRLLGISPIYLQECIDARGAEKYMLHIGQKGKYQYRLDEVYGPLKIELEKNVVKTNEANRVELLLNVLDSLPTPCYYRDFLEAACRCDLYSEFRRLGSGVHSLLEQHNSFYY